MVGAAHNVLSVSEVLEECYCGFGDSSGVLCVDICFAFFTYFLYFFLIPPFFFSFFLVVWGVCFFPHSFYIAVALR